MVVPEIYSNGFSLHDLDEMEKIILDHLAEPLSVESLLLKLQVYAGEDVIENHLEEYNNLIVTLIKQLVLKKAIRPYKITDSLN